MLAIDCQPISMVEDVGFRHVLKCWNPVIRALVENFTETIIPVIYRGMKEEVLKLINNSHTCSAEGNYVSFATDAWSSSVNDASLLSLMAHWIDSQFKRTLAVLNAHCLTKAHTGK